MANMLYNILAYKVVETGRQVIGIDPKYTSQDCSVCGRKENRSLWVWDIPVPNLVPIDTAM